jgi:hypothetical protein
MTDRNELTAIRIVVGCALSAYVAGEHLQFATAPAKQAIQVVIASSTSTTSGAAVGFSPMTFAKVEPPPPAVPPGDKQEQT